MPAMSVAEAIAMATAPIRPSSTPASITKDGTIRNEHRQRLVLRTCEACAGSFWCIASNLRKGGGRYCSTRCAAGHVAATGAMAGANNPRWLGGVSLDNMRYRRRQRERWPEREEARRMTHAAIARGELVRQPCEKCQAAKTEAHHDDYTKPLAVRWLCRRCHVAHHTNERRRARKRRRAA